MVQLREERIPEMPLVDLEDFERIEAVLRAMEGDDTMSFFVAWIAGLSLDEVARLLDIPVSVVRSETRRAKANAFKLLRTPKAPMTAADVDIQDALAQIRSLSPDLIAYLRSNVGRLHDLRPELFEELIAEFFASWGFDQVGVVGRDRWTGADVIAIQCPTGGAAGMKYFIEVKRTRGPVGIQVVEKVLGAVAAERPAYGWHVAMIVTTSRFSEFTRYSPERLSRIGIELRDGDDVRKWLGDYRPSPTGLWLPSARMPTKELGRTGADE